MRGSPTATSCCRRRRGHDLGAGRRSAGHRSRVGTRQPSDGGELKALLGDRRRLRAARRRQATRPSAHLGRAVRPHRPRRGWQLPDAHDRRVPVERLAGSGRAPGVRPAGDRRSAFGLVVTAAAIRPGRASARGGARTPSHELRELRAAALVHRPAAIAVFGGARRASHRRRCWCSTPSRPAGSLWPLRRRAECGGDRGSARSRGPLPGAVGGDVGARGAPVGAVAARAVGRGVDVDVRAGRGRADAEPGRAQVADQGGQPEQRLRDQQVGDASRRGRRGGAGRRGRGRRSAAGSGGPASAR